jgi:hypothetical protein
MRYGRDLAVLPEIPSGTIRSRARRNAAKPAAEKKPPFGEGLFPVLDPLTVKELKGLSRHWQNHVGRVLHVGLVACVLLRWWSEVTTHPGRYTNSDFAVFGRTLFEVFAPGQMLLVFIAAVSASSDMIIKEVRTGTLGLLDLACLSPSQIAVSKWKAVMVSMTMLVLCGLPVMAICVYLGGVGPWELAWSLTLTWTLAALGAAVSLKYSAICHNPLTPIVKTFGVIFGSSILMFCAWIFGDPGRFIAALLSPIHAALAADLGAPGEAPKFAWIFSTVVTCILVGRTLQTAAMLVRRRVVSPLPTPRPMNDPELFESNYKRLTLRGPRTVTVQRRIWDRYELLWKEWITRPANRYPLSARIAIGVVAGFLIWVLWNCSDGGFYTEPLYLVGGMFLVLATLNGAILFGTEKDGMKIDMLLSTPLSSLRIVGTKLMAGLFSPEAIVAAGLWLAAVRGWFWRTGWEGAVAASIASLLFLLFSYALGTAAALFTKTVRSAVLVSLGLIALLVVGLPWVVATLFPPGLGGPAPFVVSVANELNLFEVLGRFHVLPGQARPRFDLGSALRAILPFSAIYGGLILAMLVAMFRRFRSITGRARG